MKEETSIGFSADCGSQDDKGFVSKKVYCESSLGDKRQRGERPVFCSNGAFIYHTTSWPEMTG